MKIGPHQTRTTNASTIADITLERGATLHAPNLVTITGSASIGIRATFEAPLLRQAHGLTVGAELKLPKLEATTGIVEIRGGLLQAPEYRDANKLELFPGGELYAPQLQTIRTLFIHQSSKLNARQLRKITDMLRVHQDAVYNNDTLLEVGCCDLRRASSLLAARLAKCADLYVEVEALLHAPLEQTGTIYLEPDASIRIEELQTIHGDLGIGDGAVFDARNLQVIEGDFSCCANGRFISGCGLPRFGGEANLDPDAEWTEVAPATPKVKV